MISCLAPTQRFLGLCHVLLPHKKPWLHGRLQVVETLNQPQSSLSLLLMRGLFAFIPFGHTSSVPSPACRMLFKRGLGTSQVIRALRQPSYITIRKLHPLTTDSGLTLIVKCLWSIPLVIAHSGFIRAVHWQLDVVSSQSVKVGVMVREQSTLIKIFSHRWWDMLKEHFLEKRSFIE